MNHLSLKQLLDTLTARSRCHICIHDVSGILSRPMLLMNHEDQIHDTPFCTLAKSTQKGYDACIRCKDCANHKASSPKSSTRPSHRRRAHYRYRYELWFSEHPVF